MPVEIKQFDLNLKRRFDPLRCDLTDFRSSDRCMRSCLQLAWTAARTDLPVLLLGESGVGKTLLSRAIHASSRRSGGAFVSFNAAALSESLLDSQLFGHEAGAFTGAARKVRGKFEIADGGTLFLDEIADMSPTAQAKILRAVEYGEYEPLGSETLRRADVRLISASHLDRERLMGGDMLRRDLFHRLNGITIEIPPLRRREYDLPLMMVAELEHAARRHDKTIRGLSREAAHLLLNYHWPGNLRELNRVMRAAVVLNEGDILQRESVLLCEPSPGCRPPEREIQDLSLRSAVRRHIDWVLEQTEGNKSRAARELGVSRSTLDRKLSDPC